ncbi:hypothetical protein [Methylocaldum szegediense]|jgi:hypothetical protein|uniref:Integron gene cassette protein n=1 Tax=Methylocaldum szegediense TaxID=73780 RepID=A0ABM9I8X2_9GAMM|nr:hypothetical protein [Methylocaldum szegediense]CAI8964760.1 conserved protein of unknown function [Methylocaldum szegediense]
MENTVRQETIPERTITITGEHAELASPEEIAAGISAAAEVFARNGVDPLACAAAIAKLERDELLSREEALLCVIWDHAEDAAFRAVTLGWLSRAVDIRIAVS